MLRECLAGLEVQGSWDDVVSCCEQVSGVLRREAASDPSLDEWDAWRPLHGEVPGREVGRRTVRRSVHGPVDVPGDGLLRRLEAAVYGLMTRAGNYYFDSDLLSAAVERAGRDRYSLTLIIHSRKLRQKVKARLLPQN